MAGQNGFEMVRGVSGIQNQLPAQVDAALALAALGTNASTGVKAGIEPSALPELITALKAADDELRYRAARALEAMSTNARPAAAALAAATNDAHIMVQRVAERTLKELDVK